jgi:CRP/FNR family cyclic AMP-dependent transcriptional regulator
MNSNLTLTPLQALQRQALFQATPEARLAPLVEHTVFQKHLKGHVIFQKNDPATHLVLLIAGQAQTIQLGENNKPIVTNKIEAGNAIGELSVIDGQSRATAMIASSDVIIALIPNPIAKHFFIHEPTVTEKLLQLLCLSMRQAGQIQSVLSTNRAHSRIYHLLLNSATSHENNVMVINNPPTQHDIAARVNVSRETVSRALQVLLKQGIVQKDIKRLIVRNPEKLEQLAKGRAA